MTIRNAYENCLIELNKVLAPSLLVDDFIYMFNKAVQQYINKRYNLFETKQLLTDDLRVLTKTIKIEFPIVDGESIEETGDSVNTPYLLKETGDVFGTSYRCVLPNDYVHMLNCICEFTVPVKGRNCKSDFRIIQQGANKLDTSQWAHVINNYYMRPSIKRPYYYIINIEDPVKTGLSDDNKTDGTRYGNSVLPIMLIKCGEGDLQAVYIDYLRAPEYLTLDQDLLDTMTDNSQVIEFPDYVIYEIINEIVKLILENTQNPRIQTNPQVNQTIA